MRKHLKGNIPNLVVSNSACTLQFHACRLLGCKLHMTESPVLGIPVKVPRSAPCVAYLICKTVDATPNIFCYCCLFFSQFSQ